MFRCTSCMNPMGGDARLVMVSCVELWNPGMTAANPPDIAGTAMFALQKNLRNATDSAGRYNTR